jgi:hypothetical protein
MCWNGTTTSNDSVVFQRVVRHQVVIASTWPKRLGRRISSRVVYRTVDESVRSPLSSIHRHPLSASPWMTHSYRLYVLRVSATPMQRIINKYHCSTSAALWTLPMRFSPTRSQRNWSMQQSVFECFKSSKKCRWKIFHSCWIKCTRL